MTGAPAEVSVASPGELAAFQTGFLIHDVSRLGLLIYDQHIKPVVRITHPQWWMLANLSATDPGHLTQMELSVRLDTGKVAVGKMIDRLEELRLVQRVADPRDRRVKRIWITKGGLDLLRQVRQAELELSAHFMRDIPTAKQPELIQLLATIKRNLQQLASRPKGR